MSGLGRLARAVIAAVAVAAAAPPAESQERAVVASVMSRTRGLARYLDLASAYRTGDRPAALQEILDWSWIDLEKAARDVRRMSPEHTELPVLESAALMHVHAALLSLHARDPVRANEHAKAALAVFRHSRRVAGEGAAARLAPRDFYVALAAGCQAFCALDVAETAATVGLEALPADPRLLYVSACIREASSFWHAAWRRKKAAARTRDEAEALLRSALRAQPDNAEAQLRLGRILLEKGRFEQADLLLRPLAASREDARLRHLAWLFLGRVREGQRRWPEARQAYAQAVREFPDGQAARLALAWATEQLDGPRAAHALVVEALSGQHAGDEGRDPWLAYPYGPRALASRLLDELDAQLRAP